jgi:hypothetical protein
MPSDAVSPKFKKIKSPVSPKTEYGKITSPKTHDGKTNSK